MAGSMDSDDLYTRQRLVQLKRFWKLQRMKSAMRKREVLHSLRTNTQIREVETIRSTEHGITVVGHLVNRGALNLYHGAFMKRAGRQRNRLWLILRRN